MGARGLGIRSGRSARRRSARLAAGFALLLVAGCGFLPDPDAGGDPDPTGAGGTTGPTTGAAVGVLEDVRGAVVQIVARGTFVDPEAGLQTGAAGAGSGFVIDPSGIAVTNNHVVTGAATLSVYVDGEDEPRNARVLAGSECSDLAVIDIDGPDLPYLEFASSPSTVGTEVYSAGFPLGDPEYTLTRGIVSKERADGESGWASVDGVIEHDATINPGNSGGPLVSADGRVIGVNYAGSDDTNQYFAISAATAVPVVERLRAGEPVDWIGINGSALLDDESGDSGVWVAAVESGSPAATLGLAAGDLVRTLENLPLGADGTMADYCDVLRTKGADAAMRVQVLRPETGQLLQGVLNDGSQLVDTSLTEIGEGLDVTDGGEDTAPTEYVEVSDDSGRITVQLPDGWADLDGSPYGDSPRLVASDDLGAFAESFSHSGVIVIALPADQAGDPTTTLEAMVADIGAGAACPEASEVAGYEDALYTGSWQLLGGCDGTDASFVAIVAVPEDGSFAAFVGVQVVTAADETALEQIIATFVVSP